MIWIDLFISQMRSDADIAQAVALACKVSIQSVAILNTQASPPVEFDDTVRIAFDRTALQGEFPARIGFVVRDAGLARWIQQQGDITIAQAICRQLDVDGLMDDPACSDNPYAALYLTKDSPPVSVALDPDRMDIEQISIIRSVVHATA